MVSPMTLTPTDLAEMKARLEAATPGPWYDLYPPDAYGTWETSGYMIRAACHTDSEAVILADNYDNSPRATPEDRALIAHAPSDLARLIAEVERLTEHAHYLEISVNHLEEEMAIAEARKLTRAYDLLAVDNKQMREQVERYEARAEAAEALLGQCREPIGMAIAYADENGDSNRAHAFNELAEALHKIKADPPEGEPA